MRGPITFVLVVAVGLASGCGGGGKATEEQPLTVIYSQALAPQKVTCGMFDENSPKAAAFVEQVGRAAKATNDHAYVALRDICFKSKKTVHPYHLAVTKLRAGDYK